MDTIFLLVAACITLAALTVGDAGARVRRGPARPIGRDLS